MPARRKRRRPEAIIGAWKPAAGKIVGDFPNPNYDAAKWPAKAD